jgi:CheY-like chemotaxis protein
MPKSAGRTEGRVLSQENTRRAKCILIVDDDQEMLKVLEKVLHNHAESVAVAADGHSALEFARQQDPSLIISDFHMPGLDGIELLRALLEHDFRKPVIWTTGYASEEIKKLAWRYGVYEILEKPFLTNELLKCVDAALQWCPEGAVKPESSLIQQLSTREVHLHLAANTYAALQAICESRGISISTYVEELLKKELDKAA